ncbi:MAG: hypothetical protein NTW86_10265 [Candidatus Sumerlaeota bacterium]|nr:hypothetical protein [Candidatus Sumerlaeota bacterium]
MRKPRLNDADELRPEYDFVSMKGGVRGKYVRLCQEGTNLILLDEDVAAAFPTAEAVNDALRAVLEIAVKLPRPRRSSRKRVQPARGAGRHV